MPRSNGKDVYYFSHDCNARNDNKILAMRSVYGAEGYGLYWMLIEILREQPDYRYPMGKYSFKTLAAELHCDEKRLEDFVLDCCVEFSDSNSSLLKMDENHLWSESLNRRMKSVDEISSKRKSAAEKRWGARADANALQEESKEEQNRAEQNRADQSRAEQNSDCIAAAAALEEMEFSHLLEAYQKQTGRKAGKAQGEKLKQYMTAMSAAVVQMAFQIAEDAGAEKWAYTKRILDDWMEAGVASLSDAEAERAKRFGRQTTGGGTGCTPAGAGAMRKELDWMDKFLAEHGDKAP